MKKLKLTKGYFTKVDDVDFDFLSQFKWHAVEAASNRVYAKNDALGLLHRHLLNGEEIDHINGDSLDNRKSNLRSVTHHQNLMNKKKYKNNTTGYKGVRMRLDKNKYQAEISQNGKTTHLGYFQEIKDAAIAYDQKAKELFGAFALTNFN